MWKRCYSLCVAGLALIQGAVLAAAQENWPQWRGPEQNGISASTGLPTEWDTTKNVVWKTPLPSWSGSSPIVWGDRVLLTSPSAKEEGGWTSLNPFRGDPGGEKLLMICLSTADGKVLWATEFDAGNEMHRKHNDASPSPVTDGERVWAVSGRGVVACFDFAGKVLWKRYLAETFGPLGMQFGYASSPLLHEGRLILQVLHGFHTDAPSYLVAFDGASGDVLWRVERPTDAVAESPDAYTTPTVLHYADKDEIVVSGGDYVTGHDPATGKEVWRAGGLNPHKRSNYRMVTSPVAVDGMVYAGSRQRPLLALRAGGEGDITESHLAWKWDEAHAPDVPTPACDGTHFYMADDKGSMTCLNAKTGEVIWGPERTGRATVSASPIVADGKIYLINEDGITTVLAAGPDFKLLASNDLESENTLSTPAVAGSRLYIRTAQELYCIGAGE